MSAKFQRTRNSVHVPKPPVHDMVHAVNVLHIIENVVIYPCAFDDNRFFFCFPLPNSIFVQFYYR
jgi:hypothetical protein